MPTAVVLGAGLVGQIIAVDLASEVGLEVILCDRSPAALERAGARAEAAGVSIATRQIDLSDDAATKQAIAPADVVCGALASVIGLQVLRTVIEAGKPYADITFMPENALQLDDLAREKKTTAIVDFGVAPGMSNLLAARSATLLDECHTIEIYVGGLPVQRRWPFEYKAGFAPYDVIEEYTRPARYIEDGRLVTMPALSEPELLDFEGIGTLESFNTDGLRSLAETLDVPNMKEKTLRYPGHIELMRVFRETGLFSHDPIEAGGVSVRPIDVISALMFPKWTYEEGERDLTVMRIIAEGAADGAPTRLEWGLLDFHDAETNATSMSRTTGVPCAIAARLLLEGAVERHGVLCGEHLAESPDLCERILAEHESRGIRYESAVESIEPEAGPGGGV